MSSQQSKAFYLALTTTIWIRKATGLSSANVKNYGGGGVEPLVLRWFVTQQQESGAASEDIHLLATVD